MSLFPVFLKLEGKPCLVVGAGSVAHSKIQSLLRAWASVRVVAPSAHPDVAATAGAGAVELVRREFVPSDLDGVVLVIAATSSPEVNESVYRQAGLRNVLCNAVDDPEHCDFYYPAIVQRGKFQIAISTDGKSPALAQRLRRELEEQFGPEYETWVEELGKVRKELFARDLDPDERKRLLHELAGQSPKRVDQHGR